MTTEIIQTVKQLENSYQRLLNVQDRKSLSHVLCTYVQDKLTQAYQSPEFFEVIVANIRGVRKQYLPKAFKALRVLTSASTSFSGMSYESYRQITDDFDKSGLKSLVTNRVAYADVLADKGLLFRGLAMLSTTVSCLNDQERLAEFLKTGQIQYQVRLQSQREVSATLHLEMFTTLEIESLTDISVNFETYRNHPTIGKERLRESILEILEPYYAAHYGQYISPIDNKVTEFKIRF